jgi:hypothetical protein
MTQRATRLQDGNGSLQNYVSASGDNTYKRGLLDAILSPAILSAPKWLGASIRVSAIPSS